MVVITLDISWYMYFALVKWKNCTNVNCNRLEQWTTLFLEHILMFLKSALFLNSYLARIFITLLHICPMCTIGVTTSLKCLSCSLLWIFGWERDRWTLTHHFECRPVDAKLQNVALLCSFKAEPTISTWIILHVLN